MRGAVLNAPGDVRVEEREDPKIETVEWPAPMGHERRAIKALLCP
jgi:hypothetical protein